MKEREKKNYIKQWQDYISGCNTLLWVSDDNLANEVRKAMQTLKDLVPRVADDKIAFSKKRMQTKVVE